MKYFFYAFTATVMLILSSEAAFASNCTFNPHQHVMDWQCNSDAELWIGGTIFVIGLIGGAYQTFKDRRKD